MKRPPLAAGSINPVANDLLIIQGDARAIPLADSTVQCVVTSPPYWGLRKYSGAQDLIWGGDPTCSHQVEYGDGFAPVFPEGPLCRICGAWRGSYGLEPTIDMYVDHTVQILREIRRVLRPDGVVFWNFGDTYAANRGNSAGKPGRDNMNNTYDPPVLKRAFSVRRDAPRRS